MKRVIQHLVLFYTSLRRRLACWFTNHARFVGLLWVIVGFCAVGFVRLIKPDAEARILEKLHEFADPYLVGTVAAGVVVGLGLWNMVFPNAGENWRAGLRDEFSDAATNFAMISLVLFLWEGLSQGFHFANMLTPAMMTLAAIITSVTEEVLPSRTDSTTGQPRPVHLGVEFTMPDEGAKVSEYTRVKGTARSDVPAGMELWLIRRWFGYEEKWFPLKKIDLNRVAEGEGYEWAISSAFIGGNPGKGEKRWLEVWVVGSNGRDLIEQYFHGERVKDKTKISEGITSRPADMTRMARRLVERQ